MNIRILLIGFLLFGFSTLKAQKPAEEDEELKSKFFGYGVTTNTRSGLIGGVVVRSSTPVKSSRSLPVNRYIAIEAVNIKHPKEYQNALSQAFNKITYGKTNYLFSVRPEYGREWYFFRKESDDSMGLSLIFAGGPSIGVVKPYYIKYITDTDQTIVTVFDPDVHFANNILGGTSVWQNLLTNVSVVPGIHVKGALNFDLNTFGDNVTGIELGTTFEVFSKAPQIMSPKLTSNPQAFASAYLTLYLGNKKMK